MGKTNLPAGLMTAKYARYGDTIIRKNVPEMTLLAVYPKGFEAHQPMGISRVFEKILDRCTCCDALTDWKMHNA